MKILLTGKPGIGKTTVVKKLANSLKDKVIGFWTEEIRGENGKRVGFKIITTNGKSSLLAKKDWNTKYTVGSYHVDVQSFEKTVLPILEEGKDSNKIIIIDEIGKMELFSEKFLKVIEDIFLDEKKIVIATIPVKNIHPFVKYLRENFPVIEVTYSNRNVLPEQILKKIKKENR